MSTGILTKSTETSRLSPALQKAFDWLATFERLVSVILLINILCLTVAQVVARYILASPISWSDELARYSYVWLTFIAAAGVMNSMSHIRVDVGSKFLNYRTEAILNSFGLVIVVACCVYLAIGSIEMLEGSSEGHSPALKLPMQYFYGTVSFALLLIGFHAFIGILRLWSKQSPPLASSDKPKMAAQGGAI